MWNYSMQDGYLAPTTSSITTEFTGFAKDENGIPYNRSAWCFASQDGYPYIKTFIDNYSGNAFLYAKTNGSFAAGSPFLKTQSGKSEINSAFVKG